MKNTSSTFKPTEWATALTSVATIEKKLLILTKHLGSICYIIGLTTRRSIGCHSKSACTVLLLIVSWLHELHEMYDSLLATLLVHPEKQAPDKFKTFGPTLRHTFGLVLPSNLQYISQRLILWDGLQLLFRFKEMASSIRRILKV